MPRKQKIVVNDKLLATEQLRKRVAQAIEASPLSQVDIAKRLGVGDSLVSKWVNKRQSPQPEYLAMLPAILEVDGHWLLTGERRERTPTPSEAARRLQVIRRLSDPSAPSDEVAHSLLDYARWILGGGGAPGGPNGDG